MEPGRCEVYKHSVPLGYVNRRREITVQNDNPCAKREVCSLKQCTQTVPINSSLFSNTRTSYCAASRLWT
ncbi:hypothetical protein DPMN_116806 [Dreissena polymorpha]|uniref:Uncharacterized protein n=1 Tax=Dreissena polymorpha TaxID=45954 RepID=A0A9D4H9N0_DREPO|nr:hypothetical protein DPMN_104284 [Dreissena polymorpha]KAH3843292.1 hypothetical protein DPMN_116806 [Dreissena polymorpha]